ncbi:MAG: adenylosuccinate lyase [Planctomycetota bacterium]|nr:MAG: adenylosuccinate lyase [Planctomycetota bacterium]
MRKRHTEQTRRTVSDNERFIHPLVSRYASDEMAAVWSPGRKHRTWRRLWVALAEAEQALGLPISDEQIAELKAHVENIDFDRAAAYERQLRHDVMAHVHAYGDQCPKARGIIHLGATSCYVTDNTDLILIRDSLRLVRDRTVRVVARLADFARAHRDLPCLGFTHLQPAQPTTVGKRAALWCYDLCLALEELEHRLQSLRFRGVKGTTGTQASFLSLFGGDDEKVRRLDRLVAEKMGFAECYAVTGQTYPRSVDAYLLGTLAGMAAACHKFGNDIRLLQSRRELEEPFAERQVGSSAMAYKRNPMRAERLCALARYVMNLASNASDTAATQWLERTLDDSANRRMTLPEAFLAIDAVLRLYGDVAGGLVVYPRVIRRNLEEELPFMATEEILMAAVRAGGDRQELHERIRRHSLAAARRVKEEGGPNDLLARLKADPGFANVPFEELIDVQRFVGRAPQQVDEFLEHVVQPILDRYADVLKDGIEDHVTL